MQDLDLRITVGALLHDIGKVIYREGGSNITHSEAGYEYLKELGIEDNVVLDSVRYHHASAIKTSSIADDDPAYIVYMSDNIASSVDRRNKEEEGEKGFELHVPMQPVFNILNGNSASLYYSPDKIQMEKDINYPSDEKKSYKNEDYRHIINNISNNLRGIAFSEEYINSLLEVLEANLSYIPSSTSKAEIPDISLFDHLKLTAAFSCCMRQFLTDRGISNYRDVLFSKSESFYDEKAFLIASMDISGIQKFIYTIHTTNALKTLRARSFYLEILMEHLIDELLDKEGLSRSSVIYSGGGHCYLLLPNTEKSRKIFDGFIHDTNQWFISIYETDLFIAGRYSECSANSLKNEPGGSYEDIFRNLSSGISVMKGSRYSPEEIMQLNRSSAADYSRECIVCKRLSEVNNEGRCPVCSSIEKLSAKVLYSDFFTVFSGEGEDILPLPGGYGLIWDEKDSLKNRMENDSSFVRAYSKNRSYTGRHVATKLWVGSYSVGATFQEFAEKSRGIKRVGILRADVDNLGDAFVSGFRNKKNNDRYLTISRTATLSRQLSLFFKLHINKLMESTGFTFDGKKKDKRNLTIVYSGGDDIFVVGAWDEVIEFAIDMRNAFFRYSEGMLTISAGLGIYDAGYPISLSAKEVESMVDKSKKLIGKDGITLLEDGEYHNEQGNVGSIKISDGTYKWADFEEKVIGEKYRLISEYFGIVSDEHGTSLLYRMLELIRHRKEKLNLARFVYLLSRLEPEEKEKKEAFELFSRQMYEWIKSEKDCRELKTAITVFVYLNRKEEE